MEGWQISRIVFANYRHLSYNKNIKARPLLKKGGFNFVLIMNFYKTKITKLPGSNYKELKKKAYLEFKKISQKTRRQPYIKSAYFNKQKIFLNFFWPHLLEKNFNQRVKRLRYLPCAIDLIKNSNNSPTSHDNIDDKNEILHRFSGKDSNNQIFFVQIKENKKTGKKYFMSCFPYK